MYNYQDTHLARFWPLAPNWDHPIIETLIWDTFVLASDTGVEQRLINKDGSMRAEYEISYLVDRHRFRKLQTELLNLGSAPIALPLWHERHVIGHPVGDLQYSSMALKYTGGYGDGALPYLCTVGHNDPDDWCWFEGSFSPSSSTFSHTAPYYRPQGPGAVANLAKPGTSVMPVVMAYVVGTPRVDLITDSIATATVKFRTRDSIRSVAPGHYPLGSYDGKGVLLQGPNWYESMPIEFGQNLATYESPFANIFLAHSRSRSVKPVRSYNWSPTGRKAMFEFRSLLSGLKGQAVSIWIPTFSDDLKLARHYVAGGATMAMVATGLPRRDGSVAPAGMRDIAIHLHTGEIIYARITRVNQGSNRTEELAVLSTPLTVSLSPSDIDKISYVVLSRLAQDRVELTHATDEMGVTTATTSWAHVGGARSDPGRKPEPEPLIPPYEHYLLDIGIGTTEQVIGMVYDHPSWDTGTRAQWLAFDARIAAIMGTASLKESYDLYASVHAATFFNTTVRANAEIMGDLDPTFFDNELVRRVTAASLMSAPLSASEVAALTPAPFIYSDYNVTLSNTDVPEGFAAKVRAAPTLITKMMASTIMRNRGVPFVRAGMSAPPGSATYQNYLYWLLVKFQGHHTLPEFSSPANEIVFRARMPAASFYSNEVGLVPGRKSEVLAATVWGGVHCTRAEQGTPPAKANYIRGDGPDAYAEQGPTEDMIVAASAKGRQGVLTVMEGAIPLFFGEGVMVASTNNPRPPYTATVAGQYNYRSDGYIGPTFRDRSYDILAIAYVTRGDMQPVADRIVDVIDAVSGEVVLTQRPYTSYTQDADAGLAYGDRVTVRVLGVTLRRESPTTDYKVSGLGPPSLLKPGREYIVRVRRQ